MSAAKKKIRVISLGDYVKELDSIVPISLMHKGELCAVEIRIMKPMAEHSQKMMEMLTETFGADRLIEFQKKAEAEGGINIATAKDDERRQMLLFNWLHTATLVSSCSYHPTLDDAGTPVKKPKRIWEDAEDVGKNCPDDLFRGIAEYVRGIDVDVAVDEVSSKK